MEDITPLIRQGTSLITAYGQGGFTISHQRHEGSVIIMPDRVIPWQVTEMKNLTLTDFMPLFEQDIEILIVGSGKTFAMVTPMLRRDLKAKGLSADCMDTGAACRTFNILMAEERKVAAALIAV